MRFKTGDKFIHKETGKIIVIRWVFTNGYGIDNDNYSEEFIVNNFHYITPNGIKYHPSLYEDVIKMYSDFKNKENLVDLTINRMGEFYVTDVSEYSSQCGAVGVRKYRYKVSLTGTNEKLDSNGFLLDNMVLKEYFEEKYQNKQMKCESCENMTLQAIDFIRKHCEELGIDTIKRVYVQLWGSEQSFIEAEWVKK